MPIITIQRRMSEQGRIRLGEKKVSANGKEYPSKLSTFRFTSPSQRLIEEIARQYGGEAEPWDNTGKAEWQVVSTAKSLSVIVVKGGFTQWMESYASGQCIHRCDGEKDVTGAPCDPNDPAHAEAKPTTRLSVMLSEIETLGVWRMESRGWNAAAELPSMAELAMHVGDLVPATLSLVERSSVIEVKGKRTTSRFVVPVLDLQVSKRRLVEIAGGQAAGAPALEAATPQEQAAIEAPRPDYEAMVEDAATAEECRALWTQAGQAGQLSEEVKTLITARAEALGQTGQETPGEEPVEAEVVDEAGGPEADTVWQELVTAAGHRGMSLTELRQLVVEQTGHDVAACPADDLATVLALLQTGEVASA